MISRLLCCCVRDNENELVGSRLIKLDIGPDTDMPSVLSVVVVIRRPIGILRYGPRNVVSPESFRIVVCTDLRKILSVHGVVNMTRSGRISGIFLRIDTIDATYKSLKITVLGVFRVGEIITLKMAKWLLHSYLQVALNVS